MQVSARVTRDVDGFWLVYVPEVDSYTRTRDVDETEALVRDLVAALREIEPCEVSVRLEMAGEPQGALGEPEVLVPVPADELERDYAAGVVARPRERTDAERQRIADDVAAAKRAELVARYRADGLDVVDAQQAAAISLGEPAGCTDDVPPFGYELVVDGPPAPLVLDPARPWVVVVTMATVHAISEDGLVGMDERAGERHDATVAARADAPGFVLTAEAGGAEVGEVVRWAGELAEGVAASPWLVALHVRALELYETDATRGDVSAR